jgi:hypothetical protein
MSPNTVRNLIEQQVRVRGTNQRQSSREADLEHVVGALVDAVEVPQREPPPEGGADLQRAPEHEERAAAVHGSDAGEVVRGGKLRFSRHALLKQVPGAPGEGVLVEGNRDGTGRGGEGRRHRSPARRQRPPPQRGHRGRTGLKGEHLETSGRFGNSNWDWMI